MSDERIESMLDGYMECAVWTGLDWDHQTGGNPDPLDQRYSTADISPAAQTAMRADVAAFYAANEADLITYADTYRPVGGYDPWECAGHDFSLTRNHHGCGFWDRGLGSLGDRLTKAAQVYGESDLYVSDDNHLEVQ